MNPEHPQINDHAPLSEIGRVRPKLKKKQMKEEICKRETDDDAQPENLLSFTEFFLPSTGTQTRSKFIEKLDYFMVTNVSYIKDLKRKEVERNAQLEKEQAWQMKKQKNKRLLKAMAKTMQFRGLLGDTN